MRLKKKSQEAKIEVRKKSQEEDQVKTKIQIMKRRGSKVKCIIYLALFFFKLQTTFCRKTEIMKLRDRLGCPMMRRRQ